MAPFYLGLVVASAVLLVVWCASRSAGSGSSRTMNAESAVLMARSLIDMTPAGNLVPGARDIRDIEVLLALADFPAARSVRR